MKFKNVLDRCAHLLRIGPQQKDLKFLVRKLQTPKPAVLLLHAWGRHAFLQVGCHVFQERAKLLELPDIICGRLPNSNLLHSLQDWVQGMKKGGLVILLTWPYEMSRFKISASFLHVGLSEVTQKKSGAMIITTGRVL